MDAQALPPLFLALLGVQAPLLPPRVRQLHAQHMPAQFRGRAQVQSARGALAGLCARLAGLPRADGEVSVRVSFATLAGGGEAWTREFGTAIFRSALREVDGELHERFGPVQIRFRLHGSAAGIVWEPLAIQVLGLPLPRAWLAGVHARESERDGHYHFDVGAVLPWVGLLVRYEGWLDVG